MTVIDWVMLFVFIALSVTSFYCYKRIGYFDDLLLTMLIVIWAIICFFIALIVDGLTSESNFINHHHCQYTGKNETDYIITTQMVGNIPITTNTPIQTFYWKRDDGKVHGFLTSP